MRDAAPPRIASRPRASTTNASARLAPALVGHADDGGLGDGRMRVQDGLDLGRVDVLAAGDDHVLDPVDDAVVALVVALGDVAGAQPPVREGGRGRLRVAPVAREDVRPAHDAARPSRLPRAAPRLGVAQRDVDVRVRLPGEAELAARILGRQAEHVRRRLGEPVALDDLDAALAASVSSSGSGIGAPPTTASRRLERSAIAKRGSCAMNRYVAGTPIIVVTRVSLDQLERAAGVERRLEHDRGALPPGEQRLHVPAAARGTAAAPRGRRRRRADPGRAVERQVRPEAVGVA